jgi:predicted metal-dependent hydrolase
VRSRRAEPGSAHASRRVRRRVASPSNSHFEAGLALARAGRYFEAHEELELAWRAAEPEERDFFQGLVHVVVAWYQAGRGRRIGCERQLEKARRRLTPYAPSHRGIDVGMLLDDLANARQRVGTGSLDLPQPQGLQRPLGADA